MEEENPFYFGRMVKGNLFTDREKDTARLTTNFRNCLNTILISPRRWGKSSLVQKAGEQISSKEVRVASLDLFSIRTEADFYTEYAKSIIAATSSKWEERLKLLKEFFKQITPKLTVGIDPDTTFSLGLDWEEVRQNVDEILNLPERIAQLKEIKIVVCIDEFQNVATFSQSLAFQKLLRSAWQRHEKTCYCLYGSKFHMMQELFERQSMPFYRFGDLIHLEKIEAQEWTTFIKERFENTGKQINGEFVAKIVNAVACHSYYVQQLSHLIWGKTGKEVTESIYKEALDDMISQNAILYQRDTEQMSSTQLNFLKAVASGI
ncbi:MAG: ATP-binding protein, partial [Prevotellaceae bacterium]|nr:ATP-binding protein [Prevotellaceae bacterium]